MQDGTTRNGATIVDPTKAALAAGEQCRLAAHRYLKRGWSVLVLCPPNHVGTGKAHQQRCNHPGKVPWHTWKHLQEQRLTPEELDKLFKQNPQSNIGVALGPVSGIVRVDVDGPGGEAALAEISGGDLPPTLEFISGRANGGRGLLYAIPAGVALKTTVDDFISGEKQELRFQARGAETVLPPSRHASGTVYQWVPGHGPDEIGPALMPRWLVERMRAEAGAEHNRRPAKPTGDDFQIKDGARNSTLASLAGSMRRRGMSGAAIKAALHADNETRCDPPLSAAEVDAVASSVARYAPGPMAGVTIKGNGSSAEPPPRDDGPPPDEYSDSRTGGDADDPPPPEPEEWQEPIPLSATSTAVPFPADVLPVPLRQFVEAVAESINCPVDYVAVPLLAIAGAAIGNSRALEIKPGHVEHPCLYAGIIGPPGSAKTPALKAVAIPVYAEQGRRLAHYRRQKVAWEEGDEKGTPPTPSTIYLDDVTVEKVAVVLQNNPRGVAIIRDELTGWVNAMNQYRGGKGADRQVFLSAWAGLPMKVDRKGNDRKGSSDSLFVPHPHLCVVGGLPPALLDKIQGESWDGFFDRVLLCYPETRPASSENWCCVESSISEVWAATLNRLLELKSVTTDDGDERPFFVRLTSDGRTSWQRLTTYLAGELNRDDLTDPIKGHLAKFKGYGARLALILHCLRFVTGEVADEDVDTDSVDRAAKLVEYFYSHTIKVHAALTNDEDVAAAETVLSWIVRKRPKNFKRYNVHDTLKRQFPKIEALDKPLDRLVTHRYVRKTNIDRKGAGPGRNPDPVFEVNPAILRTP